MSHSNPIYFDIAATTPVDPHVLEAMHKIDYDYFGNPSSIHQLGQKSHNLIERCRKNIASYLKCQSSEIVFTSGGTESNNMSLKGVLSKGDHLITSTYEHPSILNVAKKLESEGIEITYVKPNNDGIIEPEIIKKEIKKNTKLVSIIFLNNEIGSINPIEDIGLLCKENNILFHTDAVQYIGKRKINLSELSINLLSLGAHKFYGPKGIGALYIKKGTPIDSITHGGGQESGFRAGTESSSLIFGMCEALRISHENYDTNSSHIKNLEELFFLELDKTDINYSLNGSPRLNGIMNITFHDCDGQNLLMNLDMKGIAISYGSACSSGSSKASQALLEIGMDKNAARKTVRISIGKFITNDNIKFLVDCITNIISPHKIKVNENV